MTEKIPRSKLLFARVVVGLMAAFVLGGILWYGLAPETLARVWQNLVDRPGGPMVFRFFLQPTMATIAAVLGGMKDARLGRAPFCRPCSPTRPNARVASTKRWSTPRGSCCWG